MNQNKSEEYLLIEEIKRDKPDAFRKLIRKYNEMVYRFAYRLMGNISDAEDLTQEVFLNAFRGIKRFEQRSSFSTWLYRITVNLYRNKMREFSRQGETVSLSQPENAENESKDLEIAESSPSLEEIIDQNLKIEIIKKCIDTLSEEHKTVIVLRDLEDKAYNEIAEILDCPLGTIQSRIARARVELRNKVLLVLKENK